MAADHGNIWIAARLQDQAKGISLVCFSWTSKDTPNMIERHLLPGQPKPYSHYCHVVRADRHVWVSGSVGIKQDGTIPDSTVEQFRVALDSVDACLRQAGAKAAQVVKVTIFMTDISERPLINPLRIEYFGENRPASTLVEVSALVDPRLKVEIEAVAYIDG
jgi:enamine deaminase RidA (YjgF/YER057c/UK114 family)